MGITWLFVVKSLACKGCGLGFSDNLFARLLARGRGDVVEGEFFVEGCLGARMVVGLVSGLVARLERLAVGLIARLEGLGVGLIVGWGFGLLGDDEIVVFTLHGVDVRGCHNGLFFHLGTITLCSKDRINELRFTT